MTVCQRTIGRTVEMTGRGLFAGREAELRIHPAPVDSGIVFVRADLPGLPEVPARGEFVPERSRWTELHRGEAVVRTVEHLLSAAYGLQVDNIRVETWADELPVGDGSALTYVRMIRSAGIVEQDAPCRTLEIGAPVYVDEEGASLVALPRPEGLKVTYTLDYDGHFIGAQSMSLEVTQDAYVAEIAPARTYVLRPEISAFQEQGLGKGASLSNLLIVEEDGRVSGSPRFRDECVRHKITDIIGDLCLTGRRLRAHILGYRSGHAINQQLVRLLCGL